MQEALDGYRIPLDFELTGAGQNFWKKQPVIENNDYDAFNVVRSGASRASQPAAFPGGSVVIDPRSFPGRTPLLQASGRFFCHGDDEIRPGLE